MVSLAFQSTHPRRVRPANTMTAGKTREFQSTHPRRVRRELPGPLPVQHGVSIHAPTQGATKSPTCRPRWRSCFNPRTHAGCDVHLVTKLRQASEVSIHAPTQGATPTRARGQIASFNPRTHAGCAPDSARACTRGCFNPRTHAGCDWRHSRCVWHWAVSIHAPTQGATRSYLRDKRPKLVFQSTHPRRVRLSATTDDVVVFQANPRTHAGCDRTVQQRLGRQDMFQSTHPRRVRPVTVRYNVISKEVFNPRTHAGCD